MPHLRRLSLVEQTANLLREGLGGGGKKRQETLAFQCVVQAWAKAAGVANFPAWCGWRKSSESPPTRCGRHCS
jgi:hypothetical protein